MDGCDSKDGSGEDKDIVMHHMPEDALTAFQMLEEYTYQSLPCLASEVVNVKLRFQGALLDNTVENAVHS